MRRSHVPVLVATSILLAVDVPSVPSTETLEAQAPSRQAPSSSSRPAWPAPPAPARIRFLRTLEPSAVRGRPSMLSRLLGVLTGAQVEPKMSQPYGIAVGPDHRIYVADTFGGTIHVYNLEKPDYSSIKVDGSSLIGIGFTANRMFVTDSASAGCCASTPEDAHSGLSGRRTDSSGPPESPPRRSGCTSSTR